MDLYQKLKYFFIINTYRWTHIGSRNIITFLPSPLPSNNKKTPPNKNFPDVKSTLYICLELYLIGNINIHYCFMIKCDFILFGPQIIKFYSCSKTNIWQSKTIIRCSRGFTTFIRHSFRFQTILQKILKTWLVLPIFLKNP